MEQAAGQDAVAALAPELRAQDEALARAGLEIWIGAEPTFTDRFSHAPQWLFQAEGGDKAERARALLRALAPRLGPARLVHAVGRQYPGEEAPRFCYGALFRRAAPGDGPAAVLADDLDGPAVPAPAPAEGEAWLTVTPDPAVVEVNLAPSPDLATFAADALAVHEAAAAAGLDAVRYRYDGRAGDSGGGGQVTLGGPSPERSPFFLRPQLLPRLVRYLNRHPALSYAFSPDCVGSASQGPRPDEGVRELFDELGTALDRLAARGDVVGPEELWGTLGPLLVDPSGNSHRAELNAEKLWNPYLTGRGRLGLVEFRALRMAPTPARLTAVAALLRAVAARLAAAPFEAPLADWGPALHDRLALPAFLADDLAAVLADLEAHGLGLGPGLRAALAPAPPLAAVRLGGATLAIEAALEFWPLVGDVASQERSGARLVDSSAERVQLLVLADGDPGRLLAEGREVPLRALGGGRHVGAVRWRAFAPNPGLHPGLAPLDPVRLHWQRGGEAVSVALHGWNPAGGGYPGLPADAAEAARRRAERVVVGPADLLPLPPPAPPPQAPGAPFTLDLRRPPAAG